VLACAVRLIDLGFFRIGGEQYAEENGSYGLATLRKDHVRITRDGQVELEFLGKSGKLWHRAVAEPEVLEVVRALKRRRGGGPELLAYKHGDTWVDIKSGDINTFLRDVTGGDATAKDFRTWSATVLAAIGLAVSTHADTPTARKRAVTRVVKEVAEKMGNTPAVCRASYIDPRIIDLYDDGVTISRDLDSLGADASYGEPAFQGAIEAAVLACSATTPPSSGWPAEPTRARRRRATGQDRPPYRGRVTRSVRLPLALLAVLCLLGVAQPAGAQSAPPQSTWHADQARITEARAPGRGGDGVLVAVLDTWVDSAHADFEGRVVPGADCTSGTCTEGVPAGDQCDHGTHVAGSVVSSSYGVAPRARVLPVKVLAYDASATPPACNGSVAGVAAGIRFATARGAKVINLSLGTLVPGLSTSTPSRRRSRRPRAPASSSSSPPATPACRSPTPTAATR
jgi:subtilisin family serine protease